MRQASSRIESSRAGWAGFAAVCVFALLLRAPVANIPLERDEGEYAYIAQQWLQGSLPYRDSFNQKPPGVHVMYLLIESLGGTTAAAFHWATQIYTLGTLAVLFVLGRHLGSPVAGLAAAAFAAFMTTDPSVLGNAANTEIFMLLPLTGAMLAAYLATSRASLGWAGAAGAAAAAAVLFKQVALSNLVFYLLLLIWQSRRRSASVTVFSLGAVGVLLPCCIYFAMHGAWDDFLDATVGHNLRYAARLPLSLYPVNFWNYFKPCLRAFWPILLVASVPVGRRLARATGILHAPPDTERTTATHPDRTGLVLAWLLASFLGTASGGFFRQHYFMQSIPAIALLAGIAVGGLELRRFAWSLRLAMRVACVAVPIAIGMQAYGWYYLPGNIEMKARRIYGGHPVVESPAVGRFIAAHSNGHDTVFIFGSEPQILYYAARRSASRYIFIYPLTGPFPDVRQRQQAALREITLNQPRFIITVTDPGSFLTDPGAPAELTDGLVSLVKQSYTLAAVTPLVQDGPAVLLTGEPARALWQSDPATCCSLVLWERQT